MRPPCQPRHLVPAFLLAAALVLPACGLLPLGDPGGGPCPCKEGLLCVNSVCRADCRSSDCPGDTECNSVEGADLAVCLPPSEALSIPMEGPELPVPVDLLWTIENGVHVWKAKHELPSLISQTCLEDPKLKACVSFAQGKKTAEAKCVSDPMLEGCDEYRAAKLACIRECYVASLGNSESPTMAGNTYVSYTDDLGAAWLPLRLIRFTESFGSAGAVYNFNAPGGIRAALLDIADRLNRRIYRACLPPGYTEGATVLLLRQAPLEEKSADQKADEAPPHDWTDPTPERAYSLPGELLTQGPDGDFDILPSWYACCPNGQPDCPNPGPAVEFHAMVKAGTTFEVVYVTPQDTAN